jgi:hypothetical protein
MVKIADDLTRATELVRTFTGDDWDHVIDGADRDALVWLLEVAEDRHAFIRSQAFRDVVTAAYQMGRQAGLAECAVAGDGTELIIRESQTVELCGDNAARHQNT